MRKIGRWILRFFIGLVFAFLWSLLCVVTGIKESSVAIYGYGILGVFILGMWAGNRLGGSESNEGYDYVIWPLRKK